MGVVRGVGDFASVGACAKADDVAGCTCWCAGRGSDVVCNCNYNDLQPSQQAFENMFEVQSGEQWGPIALGQTPTTMFQCSLPTIKTATTVQAITVVAP